MIKLVDDLPTYADYLLSLGTHKKNRPFEPIEVSKLTQRLIDENPTEDINRIAKRTPVSVDQLREFLKLSKLPEQVQNILGWGRDNRENLAFSAGAIISELKEPKDMERLGKSAIMNNLKKNEIERIVSLKKNYEDRSIDECIEEVKKLRPLIEEGYMFVSHISEITLNKLNETSKNRNILVNILVAGLIDNLLKEGKSKIVIRDKTIFITVNEKSYKHITKLQNSNNIRLKELADFLISEAMKNE